MLISLELAKNLGKLQLEIGSDRNATIVSICDLVTLIMLIANVQTMKFLIVEFSSLPILIPPGLKYES